MTLVIERVDYSHLIGTDLRNGAGEFHMDVTYPVVPSIFFTEEEFLRDKQRLEANPGKPRSFVIGTFTAFFDPELRRLPNDYIETIELVHETLNSLGVDTYSCFKREKYGELGISSAHATVLDGLALDTSDVLTMLPGASKSPGTWKEIVHGTKHGKQIVGLNTEPDFRQRIMESAAVHGATSELTFVNYNSPRELVSGLTYLVKGLI